MNGQIELRRVHELARLPRRASEGAAGFDLYAVEVRRLGVGARMLFRTGWELAWAPLWVEMQIRPRSGLALKHGVTVLNAPGTVDADYRGEIGVLLINHGAEPFDVRPGDRIAQLVVSQMASVGLFESARVSEYVTDRGAGGFGSTGR